MALSSRPTPGLIVAAPASGSGKTVFTLGLLRALRRRGMAVASAKVGPDYIDPAFHGAAGGGVCVNLDSWAMRPSTLHALTAGVAAHAELVVCEGVMGLFDGAGMGGDDQAGSTAEIARLTGWPVVLIVDVKGQAGSAAALLRGFATHRADVPVAAAVFNRVGGPNHRAMIERACAAACPGLPLLGWLPRDGALGLPERHLGLVQARETRELDAILDAAAEVVARSVDLDGLIALARPAPAAPGGEARPLPPLGQRIAVARDEAFAFAYPAVLEGWRRAGAEIAFFSPLADQAPDAAADAVYLPGGYPELHAGRLAAAGRFLAGLREAAGRGAWIFGECGGYMTLGESLEDAQGVTHVLAGLLPLATSFAQRRLHLGYRQARLAAATPFGAKGAAFRGHEFHYSTIVAEGAGAPLFTVADAGGRALGSAGRVAGTVMGSFVHLVDEAAG